MKIAKCIARLDMAALIGLEDLKPGGHERTTVPLLGGRLVLETIVSRHASEVSRYLVTLCLSHRGVDTLTRSGRPLPSLTLIAEGQSDIGGWSSLPPAIEEAQADLVTNIRGAMRRAVALAEVAGDDFGDTDEEEDA